MKKNRSIIITLLLLCQLLGCLAIPARPKFLPDKCTPGKEYECPTTYSCYGTGIPGVGYCNCIAYYGFIRAPPTFDTLPTDEYTCISSGLPWTLSLIVFLILAIGYGEGIYDQIVLAIRMKRHGVLKNNVATRLLIINFFGNHIAHFLLWIVMIMNLFKIDPQMYLHDSFRNYLFALMVLYRFPIVFEALVAWIDVVQKSATLTRNTSRGLTALQVALRVFIVLLTAKALWMLTHDQKIAWVKIDQLIARILPPCVLFMAWRLNHILCPKMDKKSKNYSKAVGIWVLAFTEAWTMLGYYMGIQLFIRNFFDAFMGNFTILGSAFWGIFELIQGQAWIAYIKRGNRKILAQYEDGKRGGIMGLFASSTSTVSVIEKSVVEDTGAKPERMENIKEEA